MSTINKMIVNYMVKKKNIIDIALGSNKDNFPDYLTVTDISEIQCWILSKSLRVLELIAYYIYPHGDPSSCPWCVYLKDVDKTCKSCGYGSRHGICHDLGSDYKRIIDKTGSLIGIPGMRTVVGEFQKDAKSILEYIHSLPIDAIIHKTPTTLSHPTFGRNNSL